tara:strand:- start:25315 stop:25635 length:321 start_codon:yes stop_codon:yes gene_type:complete
MSEEKVVKRTRKPKPVVTDEAKTMLRAAAKEKTPRKPRTGPSAMDVVAKIQAKDLGKDTLKFIESVSKSSGMSVKDIICCMVRMSRNSGRVNGPRYFAPQLKRFSK